MSPSPNPPPAPYVRGSFKQPLYMVTRPHTGKTLQCAWTPPGLQADFCKARSSYFLFITHFEGAVVIYKTIGFFLFPTYRCLTLIIFRTSASLCRKHHGDILKATATVLNYTELVAKESNTIYPPKGHCFGNKTFLFHIVPLYCVHKQWLSNIGLKHTLIQQ